MNKKNVIETFSTTFFCYLDLFSHVLTAFLKENDIIYYFPILTA